MNALRKCHPIHASRRLNLLVGSASHKVTLQTPDGVREFSCPEEKAILDAAEEAGIKLPYSCRAGACGTCASKVVDGVLDNSEQTMLEPEEVSKGYVLLCCSYAKSDVTLATHKESEIF